MQDTSRRLFHRISVIIYRMTAAKNMSYVVCRNTAQIVKLKKRKSLNVTPMQN